MEILPFETLSGMSYGVLNANDGDEKLVSIDFHGVMKHYEHTEALGRKLVTAVMQELSGDPDWSYPEPDTFKVGLVD
jgi:hypothetical protein